MKKQKILSILMILLPALSVILTALPNGFMMRFFAGENGWFIEYVSGFDLILPGYGNFGPMLCGVLCIAMAVWNGFSFWKQKTPNVTVPAVIACLGSLSNNLFGDPTLISWTITVLTAALVLVSILTKQKEK